jgi:hypothetical protein
MRYVCLCCCFPRCSRLLPVNAFSQAQPTSLSFSAAQGYAGVDCYTMTVGNGAGMTVDFQYTLNGDSPQTATIIMDGDGRWNFCLGHSDFVGSYTFTAIKNQLASTWVTLSPAVTYTVLPPQPTSLCISPSSVTAGQGSYRMTAGNGEGTTMDMRYTLNGGSPQTIYAWPSFTEVSAGSPDGQADIAVGVCMPRGNYVLYGNQKYFQRRLGECLGPPYHQSSSCACLDYDQPGLWPTRFDG